MIWRERFRRAGLALVGVAALAGLAVLFDNYRTSRADPTIESHNITATVVGFGSGSAARGAYIIHAQMQDGRAIDAFATAPLPPVKGQRIILAEQLHKSGRMTYDLVSVVK